MNVEEKNKQQKVIGGLITGQEYALKQAIEKKDAFRERMNKLTLEGTATYSVEYLQKEMEKLQAEILVKMQAAYEDTENRLTTIRNLIYERDAVLDLSNPALSSALALIPAIAAMGEDNISERFELAVKVNAAMIHDQAGLRALKAAYAAAGLENAGGIDDMIYSLDSTIDHLKELAYQGFLQEGSINQFAVAFAKFAKYEGMTTEQMPDALGANDSFRAAAGLPVLH